MVTFGHGKDFFEELKDFSRKNNVKQGYIPFFIAGLSQVELVGTCEKITDKNAPSGQGCIEDSVEAVGAGTLVRVHWPLTRKQGKFPRISTYPSVRKWTLPSVVSAISSVQRYHCWRKWLLSR